MPLERIARIPKRIKDDLTLIRLLKNWREILVAKLLRLPFSTLKLRNGVVLKAPEKVNLNFLFHEIWIEKFYAPTGYEIEANETVVDIGANIGVFSLYAATRADGVSVYSYEPFPENAVYFVENLKESKVGNVTFHQRAVAARKGMRTLHVADSWILHSLTDRDATDEGIAVDCVSVDDVMVVVGQCDLLKLDCEGAEYEILYSASKETLKKIKRIVCEFNVVDKEKRNGEALCSFLLENGFVVEILKPLNEESGFICAKRYER